MSLYRTVIPDGTETEINGEPYIRVNGCWEVDIEQVMVQQMSERLAKDIDREILKILKQSDGFL